MAITIFENVPMITTTSQGRSAADAAGSVSEQCVDAANADTASGPKRRPSMKNTKAHGICPDSLHTTDLALTAICEDVARTMRFLAAAVMSCGAEVLARGFDAEGNAAIEMEFSRILCVEIYCMLIALGLELDRDAHFRLTALCQCTWELHAQKREGALRLTLGLRQRDDRRAGRFACVPPVAA
ncbi:MAG TPA: hypothetical protein VIY53_02870 [Acidobacteriaceae bacterium]